MAPAFTLAFADKLDCHTLVRAAAISFTLRPVVTLLGAVSTMGAPRARVLVLFLDQQPGLVAGLAAEFAAARAHQIKAAFQVFAVELEFEMPLGIPRDRVFLGPPGAAIPEHHGAGAVLPLRDHAFEAPVFQRVVLDMHGKALVRRIEARPFGNRPAQQHAAELEPEVIVQMTRRVLLDDERKRFPGFAGDFSAGFGSDAEVALGPIFLQCHCNCPAPLCGLRALALGHRLAPRLSLWPCRGNSPPRAAPVCRASGRPGARQACRRRTFAEALLQERGKIDHLRRARLFFLVLAGLGDLLGLPLFDLLLDAGHEVVMVGVLELARLPVLGHVVDESLGQRHFLGAHAGGFQSLGRQFEALGVERARPGSAAYSASGRGRSRRSRRDAAWCE